MKRPRLLTLRLLILLFVALLIPTSAQAQHINKIIVEITTGDVRFAGTDDKMVFQIGGKTFTLDNPDRDDFERGNTDRFEFLIEDAIFSTDMVRGVGTISVTKMEDSTFGGGWRFGGIKVWVNSDTTPPIYQNANVDRWLDGDNLSDRQWITTLGEDGWSLPEEPPFPPCGVPIITLTNPDLASLDGESTLDSDCDGIPDSSDNSFDTPPDSDGDGLPDLYETQTGSSPTNPDSDGDGWHDGKNRRTFLLLTRIQGRDEDEDIGHDELYLVAEDVRFPEQDDLRGYWEMNDNTEVSPFVIIDSRATAPGTPAVFKTRLRLRESDFEFFESPTDNTLQDAVLDWGDTGDTGEVTITLNRGDFEYLLTFRWFTVYFRDPNALDGRSDFEQDGLTEALEARISRQDPSLRPADKDRIEGYDGLGDPEGRQLFIEVDAAGADHHIPYDAKQMVASRFHYRNIAPRIDDGYLGGGEDLDYENIVSFNDMKTNYRPAHFWNERRFFFRYALFVDQMEDEFLGIGANGRSDRTIPGVPRTREPDLIISRTSMLGHFSAIVFIHELGHTLGLCHPIGTSEPPIPSPTCPTPSNWVADSEHCVHYCGVGEDDITAMGDDIDLLNTGIIPGAATGIGAGVLIGAGIGAAIGALFGVGGAFGGAIVGGIVGGILGGALGSILGSDAYARVVDYHPNEWAALFFSVFPSP